jgi:hypothetical protein
MFGGSYAYLKLLTTLLDTLAESTLNAQLLGNDASLMSILFARFPDLVPCFRSLRHDVSRASHELIALLAVDPSVCCSADASFQQRV